MSQGTQPRPEPVFGGEQWPSGGQCARGGAQTGTEYSGLMLQRRPSWSSSLFELEGVAELFVLSLMSACTNTMRLMEAVPEWNSLAHPLCVCPCRGVGGLYLWVTYYSCAHR